VTGIAVVVRRALDVFSPERDRLAFTFEDSSHGRGLYVAPLP
jgi:hypothetical protein